MGSERDSSTGSVNRRGAGKTPAQAKVFGPILRDGSTDQAARGRLGRTDCNDGRDRIKFSMIAVEYGSGADWDSVRALDQPTAHQRSESRPNRSRAASSQRAECPSLTASFTSPFAIRANDRCHPQRMDIDAASQAASQLDTCRTRPVVGCGTFNRTADCVGQSQRPEAVMRRHGA
jgi:hypothetical protein